MNATTGCHCVAGAGKSEGSEPVKPDFLWICAYRMSSHVDFKVTGEFSQSFH